MLNELSNIAISTRTIRLYGYSVVSKPLLTVLVLQIPFCRTGTCNYFRVTHYVRRFVHVRVQYTQSQQLRT